VNAALLVHAKSVVLLRDIVINNANVSSNLKKSGMLLLDVRGLMQ